MNQFHSLHPVAGAEDAVKSRWCAAALDVAEDGDTGFKTRMVFNQPGDDFADSAQLYVAELVELVGLRHQMAVSRKLEALGDHDNREGAAS